MVRRVLELMDGFLQCSNVPMARLCGAGVLVSNVGELTVLVRRLLPSSIPSKVGAYDGLDINSGPVFPEVEGYVMCDLFMEESMHAIASARNTRYITSIERTLNPR